MCDGNCTATIVDKGSPENLLKRIEKMEEALSEEMARVREMDDILAGVVRHVGYTSPAKDPLAGFPLGKAMAAMKKGYLIDIDPKASPSGIPFSVALEYLKAGRKVRRPGMGNGYIHQVLGSYGAHWGTEKPFCAIQVIEAGLMTSDWMVLPESTK